MKCYEFLFNEKLRDNVKNLGHSINESLLISGMAAEGLHGRSVMKMDAYFIHHEKSPKHRTLIEATKQVNVDFAKIFASLCLHEYGENNFEVSLIENPCVAQN